MWPEEVKLTIAEIKQHIPSSAKTAIDIGAEGEEYKNVRQPWNKDFYNYMAARAITLYTNRS